MVILVSNDRSVGNKSWTKYQSHRDLSPNPYDADRVSKAIAILWQTVDKI